MATPARLLIVEADTALQSLYADIFTEVGYRVTLVDQLPDLTEVEALQPDLVILDFPVGDNSLLAQLRALRAAPATTRLPLIVCTGAVAQVRAAEAELAALDVGIVLKPFDLDELLAVVRCRLRVGQAVPARLATAAPEHRVAS